MFHITKSALGLVQLTAKQHGTPVRNRLQEAPKLRDKPTRSSAIGTFCSRPKTVQGDVLGGIIRQDYLRAYVPRVTVRDNSRQLRRIYGCLGCYLVRIFVHRCWPIS